MEGGAEVDSGQPRPIAPFVAMWLGQAASLLGSGITQFAVIWYLTTSTGSATVLAAASLAGFLPQVLVSPLSGALVDRWNRRIVMMVSDSIVALGAAVLAYLFASGRIGVWPIYVILLVRSVGTAFQYPAMQATTTLMVPPEHLARVGGLNQAIQGASGVGVPLAGALLLAMLPMPAILAIDVATAILAVSILAVVAVPQPDAGSVGSPSSVGRRLESEVVDDLRQGLRCLWGWPGLLLIILMGVAIRLFTSPAAAMLPLLVTRHFGGSALQLATLEAGAGLGMIAGGLLLGVWGGFRRRVVTSMAALALDGVGIVTIGLTPANAYPLAVGAVFASGVLEAILFGALGAMAQAVVPPALQGRVFGLATALSTASVPVGLAAAGPLADAFGVQLWFVVGGLVTLAMGVGGFLVPAIMEVERGHPCVSA